MREVEKQIFSWWFLGYSLLILVVVPVLLSKLDSLWRVDLSWVLTAIVAWAVFSVAYFGLLGWKAYLEHQKNKQAKEYKHLIKMETQAREERKNYGAPASSSPPPTVEEVLNATQALIEGLRGLMGKEQAENPEIQIMEERVWKIALDYVQKQFPLAVNKEGVASVEENAEDSTTKS